MTRWQWVLTWPQRWWRVQHDKCPWCDRPLLHAKLTGGPAEHSVGYATYCTRYHYYKSDCRFRTNIVDPVSSRSINDACRVKIFVQDPHGRIPMDAKQTIDSLIYAVHRVVLYERFYSEDMQYQRDEALDAVIRSSEAIMDRLLEE